MHEYLVCRFGVPTCLKVEHGSKFWGELVRYCETMGIWVSPIAMQNPRANGMAEKMVGTIKTALHRCMWWEEGKHCQKWHGVFGITREGHRIEPFYPHDEAAP